MDTYFELIMLRHLDRRRFFELSVASLIQHICLFYLIYLAYIFSHPIVAIVLALYGEAFMGLYLTQQLHHAWLAREIMEQ
jgi:pilus assembly protein TadC